MDIRPDDRASDLVETRSERSDRYWQKAADTYRLACRAETPELKTIYMDIAMSWAALANELERKVRNLASAKPQDRLAH